MRTYGKMLSAFRITLFLLGGGIYTVIETAFRGYTHPSMFYAGGIALLAIGELDRVLPKLKTLPEMLLGGFVMTATELIFGSVLNILFGLSVWDYSDEAFSLLGQICPRFSLYWVLLSFPAIFLSRLVGRVCSALGERRG